MMHKRFGQVTLLLVGLSLFLSPMNALASTPDTIVRLLAPTPELALRLERGGFDVTLALQDRVELRALDGDLERLADLGIEYEILEIDLIPGARYGSREGNLDPQYHTYIEMLADLLTLEALYPDLCKVYDIGDAESKNYTWGNYFQTYDIWALRISDNPTLDEPEPCVVYDARHHAREPVATEAVLAVATFYCENYGVIPFVTDTVDNTEIWIVPMVNPDGHQWVEDVDPWWRKTLYDHDEDHWVDDNEGIDPNRNYDWHWELGNWYSATYGGPEAWRAPEVAAMRDLHEQHRSCLNASYHSHGEVILYPFGYGVDPEPAVLEVANEFAGLINYSVEQSTTANGSSKDWAYGAIGATAFTVETATEFIPTGAEMEQIVQEILLGSVWFAARAWGPSIQGAVTDAVTGLPVAATIRIPEIHDVYGNGELYDMVTEAATGYYCRMRPAAQEAITLQVSADGYQPTTVQVTTGGALATVQNIELTPSGASITEVETAARATTRLGRNAPNPFNPQTTLPFHLATASQVSIRVYDTAGREVAILVDEYRAAGNHQAHWDGRDASGQPIASGVYLAHMKAGADESTQSLVLLK